MQRIFLVPGFFGFATIGEMRYFAHVHAFLAAALAGSGHDVAIHEVPTLPTASLERRARRLSQEMLARSGPDDTLHIVGHSTGGLDGRLLTGPRGIELGAPGWADLAPRMRTVTSVASPHAGAPVADFFCTLQGERLLRVLSVMTLHVVRLGSFATEPANLLLAAASKAGSLRGVEGSLLEDVRRGVLDDFDAERRAELQDFFAEVQADRSLLRQLSPRGLRPLWEALLPDADVAYASVAMMAARPRQRASVLPDPSYRLYRQLHGLSGWPDDLPPPLPPSQTPDLRTRLGEQPTPSDNDGIVPTLSQLHGTLLHVTRGDHLDVLGYFSGPDARPPHVDWMKSHSDFRRPDFETTWAAIATWITQHARR